ncbi:MAG: site-specific DNA-methyltransferase [Rhodospirillaceae bacterium]|nr:site-specific DNA-methyltransferase [Rhodospirillaceae bacterium]
MPTLRWLTRDQDVQAAQKVPYKLLEEVPELSYGDRTIGNMLIQGDNLEALKALLPYYAGQVKCIYIDPPYNTRSAFEHYDDNLEHSNWLAMMWPRLELLRDLLSEDGSIWVNIEDREGHYLKVLLDEIFGRRNFLQGIVWNRKASPANDAKYFSNDHDYIHVFAKNMDAVSLNKLEREERHNKHYTNPDNDSRGPWNSITFTGNKNRKERPNLYYSVTNPNTREEIFPPENLTWRYGKDKAQELLRGGYFYWGKTGTSKSPRIKQFLKDAKPVIPRSVWGHDEAGHTQMAMLEQRAFGGQPFGTPKPERLIERILHIATKPGELVLDSFLGSGTTAAVALKMGRRCIGIEMGDHAVTHCAPRLQKVTDGEQGGISKAQDWQGGAGFRFYRLGPNVFDETGQIQPEILFPTLAVHIWFSETGVPFSGDGASPYLGAHDGAGLALLYNGILGDKSVSGGNVLTRKSLRTVREAAGSFDGPLTIYGERTVLSETSLSEERVTFKQTPYDVRARK